MKANLSLSSGWQDEITESEAQIIEVFNVKLKLNDSDDVNKLENTSEDQEQQQLQYESESEDDYDDDFTFVFSSSDLSPIAAEDAFQNGQIRPIFPLFNRDLLLSDEPTPQMNQLPLRPPVKKVFIETHDSSSETDEFDAKASGPYCNWSKKAIEVSPELCKKSNSTGFSKIWRFRDLLHRSNSDGKDAFVFLNDSTSTKRVEKVESIDLSSVKKTDSAGAGAGKAKVKLAGGKVKVKKGVNGKTASLSAHELHYVRNRALKEEDRRRSYLPYRPGLVGFFTNVNGGLSRNVHPF